MILSSEEEKKGDCIMYLFFIDRNGYNPLGCSGQLNVPKSIKSRRALLKLATSWLGNRAGSVYLMREWTQPMCELGPWPFSMYVMNHGERLVYG